MKDDEEVLLDIHGLPPGIDQLAETLVTVFFGAMICFYSAKELVSEIQKSVATRKLNNQ